MFVYIHTHAYMRTYIHTYLHLCMYIYVYLYIYLYIYICIYAYLFPRQVHEERLKYIRRMHMEKFRFEFVVLEKSSPKMLARHFDIPTQTNGKIPEDPPGPPGCAELLSYNFSYCFRILGTDHEGWGAKVC